MTRLPSAILLVLLACLGLAARATAQPESRVHVTATLTPAAVPPGGKALVTVTFEMDPGWHIYPNNWEALGGGEATGLLSTAVLTLPQGLMERAAQWPKPEVKTLGTGKLAERTAVYEGSVSVYLPVVVDAAASPGERAIKVKWSSQACDNHGCLPEEEGEADLKLIIAADAPAAAAWPRGFNPAGFDATAPTPSPPGAPGSAGPNPSAPIDFGWFQLDANGVGGFIILLGVCFLAGFILNLMPCVLPVIPLKITGFQRAAAHAGGGRGQAMMLGLFTGLGIVAFWFVIALLISVLKVVDSVNFLFGNPLFQLFSALIIAVMAVGLMGAFTIQLPQAVQSIHVGHDTLKGSFLFGVMTAVLGTPCFGPFIGAALSWATQQPNALIPLTAMTTVGLGMAAPYVVLAGFPGLTKKLPKAGPGSDLIKQFMGILMLAVGIFFLGNGISALLAEAPYLRSVMHWWAMTILVVPACLWLMVKGIPHARTGLGKGLVALTALVVGGGLTMWTLRLQEVERRNHDQAFWQHYTPAAEQAALAQGKVTVVDFTADWCLNCKFMRATVLSVPDVEKALKDPGVAAFEADNTSRKAPGWARLAEFKELALPVVTVSGPGLKEPIRLHFGDTPAMVLSAIEKARGTSAKAP